MAVRETGLDNITEQIYSSYLVMQVDVYQQMKKSAILLKLRKGIDGACF
jgi:hypothetical protein